MLYREIMAVCSQVHTKHINTLCGQNVEFYLKHCTVTVLCQLPVLYLRCYSTDRPYTAIPLQITSLLLHRLLKHAASD